MESFPFYSTSRPFSARPVALTFSCLDQFYVISGLTPLNSRKKMQFKPQVGYTQQFFHSAVSTDHFLDFSVTAEQLLPVSTCLDQFFGISGFTLPKKKNDVQTISRLWREHFFHSAASIDHFLGLSFSCLDQFFCVSRLTLLKWTKIMAFRQYFGYGEQFSTRLITQSPSLSFHWWQHCLYLFCYLWFVLINARKKVAIQNLKLVMESSFSTWLPARTLPRLFSDRPTTSTRPPPPPLHRCPLVPPSRLIDTLTVGASRNSATLLLVM